MNIIRVAYLGLGVMGQGIAHNLLLAQYVVTLWNRTKNKTDEFSQAGAAIADTPAEAIEDADVILYCLSDDAAVNDLVFGEGGLLSAAKEGQVVIDMSTVHPDTSRKEAEAYRQKSVKFLEAPVFGSRNEAMQGGLWIVVGGEREVYEAVKPLLSALSETTHYMGETGMGTSMKLVGNLVVAMQLEALGEAMVLAAKAGLKPQDVLDVLHVTDFRSPIFDGVGNALVQRDFSPHFALKHMLKDANLIARFAEEQGAPTPAALVARETIGAAMEKGWGEENASAMIKELEQRAGVEVKLEDTSST